jgi:hypothetical protein
LFYSATGTVPKILSLNFTYQAADWTWIIIGYRDDQGSIRALLSEGIDGDGQGNGKIAHHRAVDQGDGIATRKNSLPITVLRPKFNPT